MSAATNWSCRVQWQLQRLVSVIELYNLGFLRLKPGAWSVCRSFFNFTTITTVWWSDCSSRAGEDVSWVHILACQTCQCCGWRRMCMSCICLSFPFFDQELFFSFVKSNEGLVLPSTFFRCNTTPLSPPPTYKIHQNTHFLILKKSNLWAFEHGILPHKVHFPHVLLSYRFHIFFCPPLVRNLQHHTFLQGNGSFHVVTSQYQ